MYSYNVLIYCYSIMLYYKKRRSIINDIKYIKKKFSQQRGKLRAERDYGYANILIKIFIVFN